MTVQPHNITTDNAVRVSDEMVEGYLDGRCDIAFDFPAQTNRSEAYRHGWLNGRDDRLGLPRASARELRDQAEAIIEAASWELPVFREENP